VCEGTVEDAISAKSIQVSVVLNYFLNVANLPAKGLYLGQSFKTFYGRNLRIFVIS
jgi:hypothetical protein